MVIVLLGIVWNFIGALRRPAIWLPDVTQQRDHFQQSPPLHGERLLHVPYFGRYVADNGEDVELSTLKVKVVGVLFSEDQNASQILLRSESGFDKLYRIGEAVKEGVVIQAIYPNGMLISNHGKLERINLPQDRLKFGTPPVPLKLNE